MKSAVVVKNLSKSYKDFTLDDISLSIPQGSIFGLVGENGAGKSTFINAILGIINSSYDTLQYFGKDFEQNQKEIKEEIAVIFDQTHFDLEFTPKLVSGFMKYVYKTWDNGKFENYLLNFNLPKDKKLKEFSRGMKMKFEFAVALSHDTKLLILDEATSGLDPIFRDEILDILRDYSEDEEHTVIMSSHITSDLDKIADYVAFINHGKLVFIRDYDEIQENFGIVTCGLNTLQALSPEDIVAYRKDDYSYKVLINNKHEIRKVFKDLVIENASLEDLMLYTVKGEKLV
ncbi:ABC transporter ATP-binding protein [Floricoccus penangensis]|uniref:ABC transporter ATP-binding protein n=1 Tax=Floricoccus penangensis TaxID=1859475 RepID=UPI00203F6575|nr:ABC transporter ATP-binding protein [Floricoccus penangensis]URZ88057.1 ABC transporter ATP-binding protein [Floricoccus penangensis]